MDLSIFLNGSFPDSGARWVVPSSTQGLCAFMKTACFLKPVARSLTIPRLAFNPHDRPFHTASFQCTASSHFANPSSNQWKGDWVNNVLSGSQWTDADESAMEGSKPCSTSLTACYPTDEVDDDVEELHVHQTVSVAWPQGDKARLQSRWQRVQPTLPFS